MNDTIELAVKLEAMNHSVPKLQRVMSNKLTYLSMDMKKLELMIQNSDVYEMLSLVHSIVSETQKLAIQAAILNEKLRPGDSLATTVPDFSARPSTLGGDLTEHAEDPFPMQVGVKTSGVEPDIREVISSSFKIKNHRA
jgi:hypothetical protein